MKYLALRVAGIGWGCTVEILRQTAKNCKKSRLSNQSHAAKKRSGPQLGRFVPSRSMVGHK